MAFFGQAEMGYLGFWVPHDGVKSVNRKIQAIKHMEPPTYQK